MKRKTGFTLIELLIVVAIIAILAAIAVPNFLEARTRALVSRAENDMRTFAIGMESYRVDNNSYPASMRDSPLKSGTLTLADYRLLSTPVSYLSEGRLADPFRKFGTASAPGAIYRIYAVSYATGVAAYSIYPYDAWMTWSYGPDLTTQSGGYNSYLTVVANEGLDPPKLGAQTKDLFGVGDPSAYKGMRYDPTNGTVSIGDIHRWEGMAKTR